MSLATVFVPPVFAVFAIAFALIGVLFLIERQLDHRWNKTLREHAPEQHIDAASNGPAASPSETTRRRIT